MRYQLDTERHSHVTKENLQTMGAKNIRTRRWLDWNNQPESLTFTAENLDGFEAVTNLGAVWNLTTGKWTY